MPEIDWMRKGRYGVMCHYLSDMPGGAESPEHVQAMTPGHWQRQVDAFDVEALAGQVASTGAAWLIFTLGQCSGYFCSPNRTYDDVVDRRPSRLSRRDLLADLAAALKRRGVRMIAYLPSHAPTFDRQAVEALRCTPRWDASHWQLKPGDYLAERKVDERLGAFQRHWEDIVREWSLRWGDLVSGWWIDGCYYPDRMYRHEDEPNLFSFAAALKAGNPAAVVTFNSGVKLESMGGPEDYTAGETMHLLPVGSFEGGYSPIKSMVDGSQTHILTHLGRNWRAGDRPRFNDMLTIGYTRYVNDCGGAITWDVPIDAKGGIPQPFIDTLTALSKT